MFKSTQVPRVVAYRHAPLVLEWRPGRRQTCEWRPCGLG